MAKKPLKKPTKGKASIGLSPFAKLGETHKPKSATSKLGYLVIVLLIAPFFVPSFVLLGIALTPSIVALFIDKSPNRYAGITILGCNLAGTMPILLDLWLENDNTVNGALAEVFEVFHMILILGAAGLGWVIYGVAPSVVAILMRLSSARHTSTMSAKQRALVIDWGEEVMIPDDVPPPEAVPGQPPVPTPHSAQPPQMSLAMPSLDHDHSTVMAPEPAPEPMEAAEPMADAAQ